MGELPSYIEPGQSGPIQPSFNRSIHIEALPTHLSIDNGALVLRQLLDDNRILDWVDAHFDAHFQDLRNQDQITHPLPELLRTQILLMAQGWSHPDDPDALREDPIQSNPSGSAWTGFSRTWLRPDPAPRRGLGEPAFPE